MARVRSSICFVKMNRLLPVSFEVEQVTFVPTFAAWQKIARACLQKHIPPDEMVWEEALADQPPLALFGERETHYDEISSRFFVPREFLEVARLVSLHSDSARWALLYRLLWRITHGEAKLLEIFVDPDVALLREMHKSVRHDIHKMRAFVRFRKVTGSDSPWYVAWFEPQHHIVEHNSAFFVDRFASMNWSILTPDRCAHWDGKTLAFTEGAARSSAPDEDAVEDLWLTYYKNIFNPGRVKVHAMQAEMPKKYWRNLPEAEADSRAGAGCARPGRFDDETQRGKTITIFRGRMATCAGTRHNQSERHCVRPPVSARHAHFIKTPRKPFSVKALVIQH